MNSQSYSNGYYYMWYNGSQGCGCYKEDALAGTHVQEYTTDQECIDNGMGSSPCP